MEFGVFAQLFVPKFERDVDPDGRAQAHHAQRRDRQGGRPERASSTCGARSTTSSTSTATCPGPRPSSATAPRITERVHLGSAIFNITPPVNKPVRIAENVALLDHLTEQPLRVRHRPRLVDHRGLRLRHRRHRRDQGDVAARRSTRSRRCGRTGTYSYEGTYFRVPEREVFPKPLRPAAPGHVGGGRLARRTFGEAGELGLGAFCFTTGTPEPARAARCRATRTTIGNATPVGDYVNDNIMGVTNMLCMEDRKKAFEVAANMGMNYYTSLAYPLARQHPEARRPPGVAEQDPRAHPGAGRADDRRPASSSSATPTTAPAACSVGRHRASTSSRFSPTTNTLPTEVVVQSMELFGREVHPAVRQGPGALHHPLPRGRVAVARLDTRAHGPAARAPRPRRRGLQLGTLGRRRRARHPQPDRRRRGGPRAWPPRAPACASRWPSGSTPTARSSAPSPAASTRSTRWSRSTRPTRGDPADFCSSDDTITMGLQACTHWDALAHVSYDGQALQRLPRRRDHRRAGRDPLRHPPGRPPS